MRTGRAPPLVPHPPRVINNDGEAVPISRVSVFNIDAREMPAVLGAGIPRKIKINRQTALNHNRARIFEARGIPSDIHCYFPSPCRRSSPAKHAAAMKNRSTTLCRAVDLPRVSIHRSLDGSTFITLNSPVLH